jgi:hypothetical protein
MHTMPLFLRKFETPQVPLTLLFLGPTLNYKPLIQWMPGVVSLGVQQQGCEADNSSPTSAKVKNGGAILSLPQMSSWHGA